MAKFRKQVQQLALVLHLIETLDHPNADNIARASGLTERTARAWIKELRELGAEISSRKLPTGWAYFVENEFDLANAISALVKLPK